MLTKDEAEPDVYINSLSIVPGAAWDPNLLTTLAAEAGTTYHDNNEEYVFGTPITGAANWYFNRLVSNGTAVDAAVAPGVYDFTLDVIGGADALSTDLLTSVPLQLEVFESIDVRVTGHASPDPIARGATTAVTMTVKNQTPGHAFVGTTWYAFTSTFGNDAGDDVLQFEDFAGQWYAYALEPGESRTDLHSRWVVPPEVAPGLYTGRVGVIGGFHDGDWFEFAVTPDVTVTVGSRLVGDADGDGDVDRADLEALENGFNHQLAGWENGDFNEDGRVSSDDFAIFSSAFARYGTAAGVAVPEPGVAAVVGAGIGTGMLRRRAGKCTS